MPKSVCVLSDARRVLRVPEEHCEKKFTDRAGKRKTAGAAAEIIRRPKGRHGNEAGKEPDERP